jgi:hypothetical protein
MNWFREGGFMSPTASLLSESTLRRVRSEFLEMPGLKLTVSQAQRLWGMDRRTCEALIDELTASRFLARTRDGAVILRAAHV